MSQVVVWFREDLRVKDNPVLSWAAENFDKVIPVYIYEPGSMGAASKWWLHHSLEALSKDIELKIFRGKPEKILPSIEADGYCWARCYYPQTIERDKKLKEKLKAKTFLSDLLIEPINFANKSGSPYKVFTPFWKKLKAEYSVPEEIKKPTLNQLKKSLEGSVSLDELDLLPDIKWDRQFYEEWEPGENGARKALKSFLKNAVKDYTDKRNIPSVKGTSRLSPHLHFGEISPAEVWRQTNSLDLSGSDKKSADVFLSELAWREFARHLLFHFPETLDKPLYEKFDDFPWKKSKKNLEAWQKGKTGIPIVDAGMRELWATGWMHNRVRMIVGSFLVKNLLINWTDGMEWFRDTLVDADHGSNTLGWQWVAGCGADAAPYFRVFNPVLQGEKFDPDGTYVKKWVPEVRDRSKKEMHTPLPHALVDLKESRNRALEAYEKIK